MLKRLTEKSSTPSPQQKNHAQFLFSLAAIPTGTLGLVIGPFLAANPAVKDLLLCLVDELRARIENENRSRNKLTTLSFERLDASQLYGGALAFAMIAHREGVAAELAQLFLGVARAMREDLAARFGAPPHSEKEEGNVN